MRTGPERVSRDFSDRCRDLDGGESGLVERIRSDGFENATRSEGYGLEASLLERLTRNGCDGCGDGEGARRGNIVIIDDLIATGGTALTCADLIHENWDIPKENITVMAIINLPDLKGSAIIKEQGYNVETLIEFEGE